MEQDQKHSKPITAFALTTLVIATLACILAIIAIAAKGKAPNESVSFEFLETSNLKIVDADGNTRAAIKYTEENGIEFSLYDGSRHKKIGAAIDPDGVPVLGLYDTDGVMRLGMELGDDGSPELSFNDEHRVNVVSLSRDEDGQFGLYIADSNLFNRLAIGLLGDGTPGIALADSEGNPRLIIGIDEDENPGISFWDEDNLNRLYMYIDNDGSPYVVLYDEDGNPASWLEGASTSSGRSNSRNDRRRGD